MTSQKKVMCKKTMKCKRQIQLEKILKKNKKKQEAAFIFKRSARRSEGVTVQSSREESNHSVKSNLITLWKNQTQQFVTQR